MTAGEPTHVTRRFCVVGRVQGVFYRDSTRREAERLGLTGYAINLADGSVEVVASGERGAVDELRSWLFMGPRLASVTSVAEQTAPQESFDRFNTG